MHTKSSTNLHVESKSEGLMHARAHNVIVTKICTQILTYHVLILQLIILSNCT